LENKWIIILLISLLSFIAYHNSLNAPFILDDIAKIVGNPDIKQLGNIKTKLVYPYNKEFQSFERNDPSRPLVYLTLTINYLIGKLNPFSYHFFNLLIHILNGLLLFFLAKEIIHYVYKEEFNIFALLAAVFFIVHPINTTVVSYIFSRSDLLATFFYVLALLFFIKTFKVARKYYAFSLLSFILALSSKQIAVTLPAIVLVFDYIFLSNFDIKRVASRISYHVPFWVIFLLYLLFRYFYLGGIGDLEAASTWSRWTYFINQPYIILRYLQLLLVPVGVCFDHGLKPGRLLEFRIFISILILLSMGILIYKIYCKKTGISKMVLFCALWFFVILSPTSSLFPTASPLHENRLYLAGFGFYIFLILLYFLIFRKMKLYIRHRIWIYFSLMVIHILILGALTIGRNRLYQDPVLQWKDVISKYPEKERAYNNLGVLYKDRKEYDSAIKEYQKALEIDPNYAYAYYNLGIVYHDLGEQNRALEAYQKSIELNPRNVDAHNNLGALYKELKRYDSAIREYRKALEIKQGNFKTHYNLGILYSEFKEYDKAIESYRRALELNPDYIRAYNNLGVLHKEKKEYGKAIQEYRKAIELNPKSAGVYNNLGIAYYEQKEYDQAINAYQKALEIDPEYADVYSNLGVTYYEKKEYENAIESYRKALKTDPENLDAYYNLGIVYYSQKRYDEALQSFEALLAIYPEDKSTRDNIETIKKILGK